MVTALLIIMSVLLVGISVLLGFVCARVVKLCKLADTPHEETLGDDEKERYTKQWAALMTYGGNVNGETKTNGNE